MKPLLTAVVMVLPCLLAGSARADVSIEANDKTVRVDCSKDPNVSLLGNHLTITATGVCAAILVAGNECSFTGSATSVAVTGNQNSVMLAAADNISVPGNNNTVTVKRALKRKTPSISNLGNNNLIAP